MMRKFFLFAVFFFLIVVMTARAQIAIEDCPDKCENSTLYQKGWFNEKNRSCVYDLQAKCDYECGDKGECNLLPTDAKSSLEMIYDKISRTSESSEKKIEDIFRTTRVSLTTGATDYEVGETGLIFAKVYDSGNPISDAFCDAVIYYPNKTIYTTFALDYLTGSRGMYTHNISIPNVTGVYPVDIDCVRPVNSTNQTHYFAVIRGDHTFRNTSGSVEATQIIQNLAPAQSFLCFPYIFSCPECFQDSNRIRFVDNITNIFAHFYKGGSGSGLYDIVINFYKVNGGTVLIGSTINSSVSIGTSQTFVRFPDITVDFPFSSDSSLQAEVCARKLATGSVDFYMSFNSTTYKGSFIVNSRKVNATIDFDVGGASEMNVKNMILDLKRTNELINNLSNNMNSNFSTTNAYIVYTGQILSNAIGNLSENMNSNFTFTNSLISTVANAIGDLSISMGNNFTNTNNNINFWGNYLNTTMWNFRSFVDGWFWTIEYKLDNLNITLVNSTLNVDYDKIALYVISYLKALEKMQVV